MTGPRPSTEAAMLAHERQRHRAARHLGVLAGLAGLLGMAGCVAAGAALGRWSLPFVDDGPSPVASADPTTADAVEATGCGPDGTVEVAAPAGTTVEIRNATSIGGLAGETGEELAARGFTVAGVGNEQASEATATRVSYPPGLQPQALSAAAHLGVAALVLDPDAAGVTVVLGEDFTGLVDEATLTSLVDDSGGVVYPIDGVLPGCVAQPIPADAASPAG